ncbi:MAG: GerMN domain-containing protein [Tissierellia bacterium]|nr:GerMN domain-containing protein [Tissierellia bacterium]
MKKLSILCLIIAIIFVGCNPINGVKDDATEDTSGSLDHSLAEISDYFPFLGNTVIEYQGIGNEFAEQKTFFEFIDGNKAQMKVLNPGTNLIKIYELKNGTLTEVYMEGEFYHIENMLNATSNKEDIILSEPIQVGNTWKSLDGYEREITGLDEIIETPYDTYTALEITTTFEEGRYQKEYYAKGVGLVAKIYTDNDMEVKSLINNMTSSSISQGIELFYPLKNGNGLSFIEDSFLFRTNDDIKELMESKMKDPIDDRLIPLLPKDVSINRINLDRGEWVVKIDLSDNFIEEINAGSSYEYELVQGIVNTLGKYYDTDKVFISLSDRPYESGHLQLEEGEIFKVSTEDIEELE